MTERAEIDWSKRKVWSVEQMIAERNALNRIEQWGKTIEVETRRRIRIAVAAFAYEMKDNPLMSDHAFDELARKINPALGTCHPEMDEFFAEHFSPSTGMWIYKHPDLDGIERVYLSIVNERQDTTRGKSAR